MRALSRVAQIRLRNEWALSFDRLVHLRAAESSDLGFLADVVISATRDQGRLPDEFDEAGFRVEFERWTTEQIAARVEGSSTYVIEIDGERVGRLRIIRERRGVELAGIQLLPRFQSRGIGSEIVALLKTEVASAGSSLELSVEKDNPRAQAFYERHGMVVIDTTGSENRLRWTPDG